MKLIDADKLADRIDKLKHEICARAMGWVEEDSYECGAVDALLDVLEYVEEAKDETKQGSWTVLEDCSNSGIYCTECNCKIFDFTHKPQKKLSQYCPHCGSKNEQFFRDGEAVFR